VAALLGLVGIIAVLAVWLPFGIVKRDYTEEQIGYFLYPKAIWSFRLYFYNPYLDDYAMMKREGKLGPGDSLTEDDPLLASYLTYCRYRFGIAVADRLAAQAACRKADGAGWMIRVWGD
jgi:hypothetical protein